MSLIRWIVGAVVFLLLLLFALQNADPVVLRFFDLWSAEAPLVFLLLLAFAAGTALGLLVSAVRIVRLSRETARLRREPMLPHPSPAPHGAAPGTAPASGPGFERIR